ncbi:LysR family transcriptional regulator [Erwinia persicina]|uniref:LysR family transcriptional regulator n=1 Tax=Erwinia persicina TaxID=55211 RepID=UPI00177CF087|nr:LysR family transcriptional regulator [Erwinia persicina]MBD8165101.1 LysR family transcriptional regulator [Erwinia persicina]
MRTGNTSAITLRAMEQFVAVAEELHFHRAAKRLNMSQPPLTSAIQKLEHDLDVILIERGNRVLGLTPAGKTFLAQAYLQLQQREQAVILTRDVAAGRTGIVRLGYVGSALYGCLPDVIRQFRLTHPQVRLELREATTAAQIIALREEALDVGVVIPPVASADDISLTPFDSDALCIAVPQDHPLGRRSELTLAALADEPFILWPRLEGRGFHLQVIRLCAKAGFVPDVAQEAFGMHAVLSLVAVGAGVTLAPQSMSHFLADRIRYYPLPDADARFDLVLAHRQLSPAAAAFMGREDDFPAHRQGRIEQS